LSRIARVFLLLVWVAVPSICLSEQSLPDTIDRIRGSVVGVGTYMPLRSPREAFLGTGFVVGNGHKVITNYHVIPERLKTEKKERVVVFSGRGRSGKVHQAKLLRADPEHDLALLEISGKPLTAMKLSKGKKLREGESVAFTGFPMGMVLGLYPVTHRGIVSAITPIVRPANRSKDLTAIQLKRMRNRFDVYQLDGTAYPGNSGSPVYDPKSGAVVGVVNSVYVKGTKETILEKPSGITYAIPVEYVKILMGDE